MQLIWGQEVQVVAGMGGEDLGGKAGQVHREGNSVHCGLTTSPH